ncbi:MAG: sigma-70 family RNA polymerase sigma factor [Acidobacteria bacterium]|nr:sigma-70 family RNA polymerase sigma factor [Acidobacteriota bacterium]
MLDEALKISLQTQTQFQAVEFSEEAPTADLHLVNAVLDGDDSAFAEIFEKYKRPLIRIVSRFFRDQNEIEEMVQRSFTQAFFSLKKFRGNEENSFPAWLTRIAVNVCYDEFRKRKRRSESFFSELDHQDTAFIESVRNIEAASQERQLSASQLAEKVLSCLNTKDRMAMILVYSGEHSLDEVANAFGISISNLKSRLFRCRNQIKGRFGYLFK